MYKIGFQLRIELHIHNYFCRSLRLLKTYAGCNFESNQCDRTATNWYSLSVTVQKMLPYLFMMTNVIAIAQSIDMFQRQWWWPTQNKVQICTAEQFLALYQCHWFGLNLLKNVSIEWPVLTWSSTVLHCIILVCAINWVVCITSCFKFWSHWRGFFSFFSFLW